jgi:hypothetical protein
MLCPPAAEAQLTVSVEDVAPGLGRSVVEEDLDTAVGVELQRQREADGQQPGDRLAWARNLALDVSMAARALAPLRRRTPAPR